MRVSESRTCSSIRWFGGLLHVVGPNQGEPGPAPSSFQGSGGPPKLVPNWCLFKRLASKYSGPGRRVVPGFGPVGPLLETAGPERKWLGPGDWAGAPIGSASIVLLPIQLVSIGGRGPPTGWKQSAPTKLVPNRLASSILHPGGPVHHHFGARTAQGPVRG